MNNAVVGLGAVILVATGANLYFQNKANQSVRREIAALREDVRLAATAAKPSAPPLESAARSNEPASAIVNALPAVPHEDIARLRDEIAALRKSTTALTQLAQTAQAAQELAKSSDSVATKLIPAAQLKNVGRATPEAGIETSLWAAVGGDVDVLAGSMTFTDTARTKADPWFAGLSENTRRQYGTPEKIIALMIARDAAGLAGMQVLGSKEVTPDNVGLRVRMATAEGSTKDETFLMRRGGTGWQMVLPDNVVEKFARKVGGK